MDGKAFTVFMNEMLKALEKLLKAPKSSLVFLEDGTLIKDYSYFYRDVFIYGTLYRIGFRTDWSTECEGYRFLLDLAAREVHDTIFDMDIFRHNGNGQGDKWAFNLMERKWHTTETLAAQIHDKIGSNVFSWIRRCIGLNPFSLSHIADMAYEADAAEGMIVFQTGEMDDCYEVYRIQPKSGIPFIAENERFVRKQLAGTGKNSLLFVRENTDYEAQYIYKGYLIYPSDCPDKEKLFSSVILKRGGNWLLQINERPVLHIKHRDVFLPTDDLVSIKERIDEEFGPGTSGKLSFVLEALHKQKHGTSVIFLNMKDRASREMMARLEENGRALRIEDVHIDKENGTRLKEILESISRIDGALICDLNTMRVLFVNAIVDGLALAPGRRDCGARHNALESAIVNLAHQDKSKTVKAFAVIFSEDGGISGISASQCYK